MSDKPGKANTGLVECDHVYISSVSPGQGEGLSKNWGIYQKLSEVDIYAEGFKEQQVQIESTHSFTTYWLNTSFVPGSVPGAEDTVMIKTEVWIE